MEKTIQDLLAENQYQKLSTQEVLASYSHIELTAEETDQAILAAKQRKERLLHEEDARKIAERNRRLLIHKRWPFDVCREYMLRRATKFFNGGFKLDEHNMHIFDLLCLYFSEDDAFVEKAKRLKTPVAEPSLNKGILLAGNFGVGKTWLMELFRKNQRQTFYIRTAKFIANEFGRLGEESLDQYLTLFKNPLNDAETFYQRFSGLCIDDMGAEDVKNHYGNKKNVVGDLIEQRYHEKFMGPFFHATSNLSSEQLSVFYGGRVVSRLRECVNLIELPGNDRRK